MKKGCVSGVKFCVLLRWVPVGLVLPLLAFGCSSAGPSRGSLSPLGTPVVVAPGTAATLRQDLHHEVAPMETLWRISRMYEVDQETVAEVNQITDPTELAVGQSLFIPNAKPIRPVIPLYKTRKWHYIVIHHTATEGGNALTIDASHQRRGFGNGMGYHFLIDNGTLGKQIGLIEVGRRWIKQINGAHANAAGMNENGIGISLVGNFSESRVPKAQLESLVFLVQALMKHYKIPMTRVIGHRDVPGKSTECPGNLFPWQQLQNQLS